MNFTPEDLDGYFAEFSKVVSLKIDSLYEKKPEPIVEKKPEPIVVKKPEPPPPPNPTNNHNTNVKKISSVKDSLTINQKFMFTKMLFKGDFEIFSQAIDKLDRFDNFAQAIKYFDENYPEWDKETEEYLEFVELLNKRFG